MTTDNEIRDFCSDPSKEQKHSDEDLNVFKDALTPAPKILRDMEEIGLSYDPQLKAISLHGYSFSLDFLEHFTNGPLNKTFSIVERDSGNIGVTRHDCKCSDCEPKEEPKNEFLETLREHGYQTIREMMLEHMEDIPLMLNKHEMEWWPRGQFYYKPYDVKHANRNSALTTSFGFIDHQSKESERDDDGKHPWLHLFTEEEKDLYCKAVENMEKYGITITEKVSRITDKPYWEARKNSTIVGTHSNKEDAYLAAAKYQEESNE